MSLGDVLVAIGALLGALAFIWDAWSYFGHRKRRLWADDLRVLLLQVQRATSEMKRSARTREWTGENIRPLEDELRSVADRMRQGLFETRVNALATKVGLIDTLAPRGGEEATVEVNLRAPEQVAQAKVAHAEALKLLRRV